MKHDFYLYLTTSDGITRFSFLPFFNVQLFDKAIEIDFGWMIIEVCYTLNWS